MFFQMSLKQGSNIKYDLAKRFTAHYMQYIIFTVKTQGPEIREIVYIFHKLILIDLEAEVKGHINKGNQGTGYQYFLVTSDIKSIITCVIFTF